MKIAQETLDQALSIVGRSIPSRPTLPVLSHVLLDGTTVSGTDLELRIDAEILGAATDDGAITVPAKLFSDFVGALPAGRVDLTLDGNTLHVECGRNEADINGITAEEYPLPPNTTHDVDISIPPYLLGTAIQQTLIAAATDEARPILTGVLFRFENGLMTLAAADGFRLAVSQMPVETDAAAAFVVPATALGELLRLLADEGQDARITTDTETNVWFELAGDTGKRAGRIGRINVVSQLIAGNFVNYRQIIPTEHKTRTIVNREKLLRALKTASIFARTEANIVHLSFGDALTITASSVEVGDHESIIDAEVAGEPLEIAFNVQFLMDGIAACPSGNVAIETTTKARPALITPASAAEDGSMYQYVIMPMHIRD